MNRKITPRIENGVLHLSSGASAFVTDFGIGFNPNKKEPEGYDCIDAPTGALTKQDMLEIAEMMIEAWSQYHKHCLTQC